MTVDLRVIAAAAERLKRLDLIECFDAARPASRPTPWQQEVFDAIAEIPVRVVRAGNQSGKSAIGARETAWLLAENHPKWTRPAHWGTESLTLIVVGRTSKQIEEELWKKIRGFLDKGTYKEHRLGNILQKVTYLPNNNTILFISHNNANEAREKAQSYVAHYVWLDEMPGSYLLVEELQRRLQARRGYFLATFTPKVRNEGIRRWADGLRGPYGHVFKLRMFDNPVYSEEDKRRIMASLEPYSESYKKTVLEGDWAAGQEAVYFFDSELMTAELPATYTRGWRHVESVDPAVMSKFGFTLWAEDPATGVWWLVKERYIEGIFVVRDMAEAVWRETQGYNVVRRVCDPAAPWYIHTAYADFGMTYVTPYSKNNRKAELIKGLQDALGSAIMITNSSSNFIDEITSCQWSETAADKIANSSSFHLLDCAQYFVDCRPKREKFIPTTDWQAQLKTAARTQREAKAKANVKVRSHNRWHPSSHSKWF